MKFCEYFCFAETESLWSQGPVTRDFLKSYSGFGRDIRLLNISAQPAMKSFSALAQPAMEYVGGGVCAYFNDSITGWSEY
jgi:hypothetical protein